MLWNESEVRFLPLISAAAGSFLAKDQTVREYPRLYTALGLKNSTREPNGTKHNVVF